MPQTDVLKRYLDAGMAFTQLTRSRAEAIVRDLVRAGEIQREQTQEWVEELVERSRKNTEQLLEIVRKEVARQLAAVGVGPRKGAKRAVQARTATTKGAAKKATKKTGTAAKKSGTTKKAALAPKKA
jgi:polyhydroxyalkanoate synthesis regulator phasin